MGNAAVFAQSEGEISPGEGDFVRTVAEYRQYAAECRKLARLTSVPDDKRAFEEMARTWEMLAGLRQRDLKPEKKANRPVRRHWE